MGATRWQAFRFITLPRLYPAIATAAGLVFMFAFTSFGIVLAVAEVGTATLETDIYRYAVSRGEVSVAAILAVVQLTVVGAASLVVALFGRVYSVADPSRYRGYRTVPRYRIDRLHIMAVTAVALSVTLAPLVGLVIGSFRVGSNLGPGPLSWPRRRDPPASGARI